MIEKVKYRSVNVLSFSPDVFFLFAVYMNRCGCRLRPPEHCWKLERINNADGSSASLAPGANEASRGWLTLLGLQVRDEPREQDAQEGA